MSQKPRTLFLTVNGPDLCGGISRMYTELIRRFPARSVELLTVADAAGSAIGPTRVTALPYRLDRAKRFGNVIRCARTARRIVRREEIGLLQVGDLRPMGYVGAFLEATRDVPYILYVHGKDVYKERRKTKDSISKRLSLRQILGRAGAVIANSRFTAKRTTELIESLEITARGGVHVVHPGTDPDRFRPDPGAARVARRWLDVDNRPLILTVARLVPRKGIDALLEALPLVVARDPDVILVIVGDGPDRQRLETMVGDLGLGDRVRFLGGVSERTLPKLYAAADVFALPARDDPAQDDVEGFGIVFCEAAASGTPVVAGDAGGMPEAVRDGETGILVPPLDSRAISEAILRLLGDRHLREVMGVAGRRAVKSYYNWNRAADQAWKIVVDTASARTA